MRIVLNFLIAVATVVASSPSFTWAATPSSGKTTGPTYSIVKLDDAQGVYTGGLAHDINGGRQVVGQVDDPQAPGTLAAYWSSANQLQLLAGSVDVPIAASAIAINDYAQIAGAGLDPMGHSVGLYWSGPGMAAMPLWPLAGDDESSATGMNRDGVICGYSRYRIYGPDPRVSSNPPTIVLKTESRPVLWRVTVNGIAGPFKLPGWLDLDPSADPDNAFGSANGIHDSVAGVTSIAGGFMQSELLTTDNPEAMSLTWTAAVTWSVSFTADGGLQVVSTVVLDADAVANAVNGNSLSCGTLFGGTPGSTAAAWNGTTRTILKRATGVNETQGLDVNRSGVLVGAGYLKNSRNDGYRAVVWPSSTGDMLLLDKFLGRGSPLISLTTANAINDQGIVVGGAVGGGYLAIPK